MLLFSNWWWECCGLPIFIYLVQVISFLGISCYLNISFHPHESSLIYLVCSIFHLWIEEEEEGKGFLKCLFDFLQVCNGLEQPRKQQRSDLNGPIDNNNISEVSVLGSFSPAYFCPLWAKSYSLKGRIVAKCFFIPPWTDNNFHDFIHFHKASTNRSLPQSLVIIVHYIYMALKCLWDIRNREETIEMNSFGPLGCKSSFNMSLVSSASFLLEISFGARCLQDFFWK